MAWYCCFLWTLLISVECTGGQANTRGTSATQAIPHTQRHSSTGRHHTKEIGRFGSKGSSSSDGSSGVHTPIGSRGSNGSVERVAIRRMQAIATDCASFLPISSSLELTGERAVRVGQPRSSVAPPLMVSRVCFRQGDVSESGGGGGGDASPVVTKEERGGTVRGGRGLLQWGEGTLPVERAQSSSVEVCALSFFLVLSV